MLRVPEDRKPSYSSRSPSKRAHSLLEHVQVPDGVEEDAFRARIEAETGLRTAGYAYTTTLLLS